MLNMFRTSIHPSLETYDFSIVSLFERLNTNSKLLEQYASGRFYDHPI